MRSAGPGLPADVGNGSALGSWGGRFLVGLSELLVGMICLSICLAADDMSDRLDRRARDASVVGGGFGSSQKSTCK